MKRVRLIYVEDADTASNLQAALKREGLNPGPVQSADSEGFEAAEGGFYVDVPASEADAARELLIGMGHGDDLHRQGPDD